MLQSFSRSFPFLLIRIVLVILEGATIYYSSIYVHGLFIQIVSNYVDGLFLKLVSPMGWVIGLAVGAFIVKYVFGLVQYYFKLAHIIFITSLILDYKPYKGSRFVYSLIESTTNFGSLALNDFTTRAVVSSLKALKNAIIETDIMSKFKDSDLFIVNFVKSLTTTSLANVINMTDEIIVSYTWFTNDMYIAHLEKSKKHANMRKRIKAKAGFMLEGMVFTVRVLPQLLINTLAFEIGFLLLANFVVIGSVIAILMYTGISWTIVIWTIILYRTLIHIFYHALIQSFRLNVYLVVFYNEVSKLEPFDIKDTLAQLLGKVPLIGALVKKSGQKIEPTGSEGTPILEGDLNEILRENVKDVAKAFNLNTEDLVEDTEVKEVTEKDSANEEEEEAKPEEEEEEDADELETVEDEKEEFIESEIDVEIDEPDVNLNDPFSNANRVEHERTR